MLFLLLAREGEEEKTKKFFGKCRSNSIPEPYPTLPAAPVEAKVCVQRKKEEMLSGSLTKVKVPLLPLQPPLQLLL